MKHYLAGVAAIALAATAAFGQGNSQGKGNAEDRSKPAQAQSMSQAAGNQRGNAERGKPDRGNPERGNSERGNAGSMQAQAAAGRGNEGDRGQGNAQRSQRAQSENARGNSANARAASDRGRDNPPAQSARGSDSSRAARMADDNRGARVLDDGRRVIETRGARSGFASTDGPGGLINGCPPGLAKKNNGCRPPGLARQNADNRYASSGPDWWGLGRLENGRYFYDDGYLLRLDGDSVAGYVPLLGGALAVGNPWPSYYDPAPVPDYYVDYFDLGPRDGYRYADNVLYRVDPQTSVITSIAALLTGNEFEVGAQMPAGYDVYNVPYRYRDRYSDGPNALYRYNDGYVYQVDPTTRLITAAIELIAS